MINPVRDGGAPCVRRLKSAVDTGNLLKQVAPAGATRFSALSVSADEFIHRALKNPLTGFFNLLRSRSGKHSSMIGKVHWNYPGVETTLS